jgi:hypothetical protein
MKKGLIFLFIMSTGLVTKSQDLHYADVRTMNLWYNQSLKMDKTSDLRVNFRDIKYQSILAFRTASGMLNVPVIKKSTINNTDSKGFLSATAAGVIDRSNRGFFKNSTGLVGLSYSQRLTDNLVYLSAGFQGSATVTRFGPTGGLFPDQFDEYGPLPDGTQDPMRAGRSFNWMSLNAGLSIYQNTSTKEWYIGGSVRHINRPFTDEQKTVQYRLAPTLGAQAGLTVKNDNQQIGVYAIANWKAEAYEYLLGARLSKTIDQAKGKNDGSSIGVGLALRMRDAVIPNVQLKLNKTTIGVHYDMNISGLRASGYSRQGFEVAIMQRLN